MSEIAQLVAATNGRTRALAWAQMSTQHQLAVAVGVSSTLFLAMARGVSAHLSDEQAAGHVDDVASVAHEAGVNALKHADADAIRVHVAEQQGGVLLVVGDSGTGCDSATVAVRSGHRPLGLLGMHAVPGEGTTVTAWLPTPPMDAAE